jgi:hypothetical protein
MTSTLTFIEKFVLDEVAGKNDAIHGYDKIIWIIRSGFLTLVFAGWAILLKEMASNTSLPKDASCLVLGMLFLSMGLAVVGYIVDFNYLRRKFRVVHIKNELVNVIMNNSDDASSVPPYMLEITGTKDSNDYHCRGYYWACVEGIVVYFAPVLMLVLAVLSLHYQAV